jgi:type IV pilus assembly protein PilE
MQKQSGFTLMELVMTVAIIAVLAAIALPLYTRYVIRSGRTDARAALTEVAARQERYRYGNPGYATTLAQLGLGATTENGRYTISLADGGATYTVSATPIGSQATNDACGILTITNLGVKGSANSDPECWK